MICIVCSMMTNWFVIPDHVIGQVFVVFIALVPCLRLLLDVFGFGHFLFVIFLCCF